MPPLSRLGQCRMLAALSVVALLFCHGALGALHLSCATSGGATPAAMDAPAHHEQEAGSGAGETHAHHCTGDEYYAVLLGLLLAFVLLLLLGARWRPGAREVERLYGKLLSGTAPTLPRGPTLPHLQVFRL